MSYQDSKVANVAQVLRNKFEELDQKTDILKAPELKELFEELKMAQPEQKAELGQEINRLKSELAEMVRSSQDKVAVKPPIDITAPLDVNASLPQLLSSDHGTDHPLMRELGVIVDIFYRMGFNVEGSRELDDQRHMFDLLNFPTDHPARDEYDTFVTVEKDGNNQPFVAPAHTSTMQNRVMKKYVNNLEKDEPIAVLVPDRVFRNEDLDARHEHTFYQFEGVYVNKGVHAGHLIATLKTFLEEYYGKTLEYKTQPFYFPFTEPSFEFALSCPFCDKTGCHICSNTGWIELLGCGLIHPSVLRDAGIDPEVYTGLAWGCGLDRLVMMKYGVEDVRHFHSAKLNFLRQF